MYEIVIIDDEYVMRDGMSTLINWEELGFHVTAVFENGAQGISWISTHKTDVVLTDLRMGDVSGIDVARFIYENNLPIKVVLISGHSDFTAAQQAMELRVDSFLLKPISFKRIKNVFMKLREELNHLDNQGRGAAELESLDIYLQECFTEELLCGVLKHTERLNKYISWLGWEGVKNSPCVVFTLKLDNREQILTEFDGDFDAVIDFIWSNFKRHGIYVPLRKDNDILLGLKLDAPAEVENDLIKIINNINALIDIKISLTDIHVYTGITEMADSWPHAPLDSYSGVTLSQLRERQQIAITHIIKNDPEQALNHYYAFINSITGSLDQFRNAALDFFAGLVERLRNDNRLEENNTVFPYVKLADAASVDTLRKNGAMLVNELTRHVMKLRSDDKKRIIENACAYIDLHYQNGITLEHTAAYVFLSPVYLSKLFKEITGINFKDYLIEKRISRACELLRELPQMKVNEISSQVGYNNEKYFYQVFARIMNCTPIEYRIKNMGGNS